MSKNIVICCDGTNNEFGPENTNVVRLIQLLDRDPLKQRLYYDPGVGTLPEPSAWSAFSKGLSEIFGLAFGRGLSWKVEEAYTYLMNVWEPGDRVFVFGFSRGAYTARVLAGMLHALGLLPHGNQNLVPYVMRLYGALRNQRSAVTKWSTLCDQFRWTFARTVPEDPSERHFHVHYVGLWDTVSSVGWAWDPRKFPYTARNPSVHAVRHAVSIDERRWFFRQNRMYQALPSQEFAQVWFPGVHSDVGGGYPESESGLWREPFLWVLAGAMDAGLAVDAARQAHVMSGAPSTTPCNDPKHESLTAAWWPAEFFPKWQWRSDQKRNVLAIGAGRYRRVNQGELIHRCALVRLRDRPDYRPRNLHPQFVQTVRSLPVVPDAMPYAP
jgi:uncharacterized protein (DUF2235 family)